MSCAASEPHSGVGSRDEEESKNADKLEEDEEEKVWEERSDEAEEEEEEDMATGDGEFFGCRWPEQSKGMKRRTVRRG